ncbi:MAG: flavodoxin domain-containing protein [Aminipila sp.]
MKTEIIYATMTGHSKKISSAIAKKLGITAYNIKENSQISNCDLLYIVSGIYGGDCSPELLKFTQNLSSKQAKKVALITSSTRVVPQNTIRDVLALNGIEVLKDEYLCKGGFLFKAFSHPNKDEINGAVKFAEKLIEE